MADEQPKSEIGVGDPPEVVEEENPQPEEETPKETPEETPEEEEETPEEKKTVPLQALKEARKELREAKQRLREREDPKTPAASPAADDDAAKATKQASEWFDKESERREGLKKAEEEVALSEHKEEVEDLKLVFDDFDEEKVVKFANDNAITDLGKAYDLMKKVGDKTPAKTKPKLPSGAKTSDTVKTGKEIEKPDDSGKTIFQVVKEAISEKGLK